VEEPTRSSRASLWVWASYGTLMVVFTMAGSLVQYHDQQVDLSTWAVLMAGLGTAAIGLVMAMVRGEQHVAVAGACALVLWSALTWAIAG